MVPGEVKCRVQAYKMSGKRKSENVMISLVRTMIMTIGSSSKNLPNITEQILKKKKGSKYVKLKIKSLKKKNK